MDAETDAMSISQCRLDSDGLRGQRERYRALAGFVTSLDRRSGEFEVRFGPDLDAGLIETTLDVERSCCPFFVLHYHAEAQRLTVSVEHADQEPALEAIADALGGERSGPPSDR